MWEMLQWLRLAVWLVLSAAVSGKDVKCDTISSIKWCYNAQTGLEECPVCFIELQTIIENDEILTVSSKQDDEIDEIFSKQDGDIIGDFVEVVPFGDNDFDDDSYDNIELVMFIGGEITKMPKLINETTSNQITQVALYKTKTQVLNAQFFGNTAENLISLMITKNNGLSVAAEAFRNCKALI